MREHLWLHTVTMLRFYLRSRLILSFAAVLLGLWTLSLVPFLLLESSGDRFNLLKMLSDQLRSFAWVYTAALGLFALWSHVHHRHTSLVFTRPVSPELWLASVFLAAIMVTVAIHGAGLIVTGVLSLAWGIPYQAGFVWLTLDGILESIIVVSVLTALAAAIHPVIAVFVMLLLNDGLFMWIDTMLLGYEKARGSSAILSSAEHVVRAVYIVLPILDPFGEKTGEVAGSLRVTSADWRYLGLTMAYALLVFGVCFLFADYRLRRKALV